MNGGVASSELRTTVIIHDEPNATSDGSSVASKKGKYGLKPQRRRTITTTCARNDYLSLKGERRGPRNGALEPNGMALSSPLSNSSCSSSPAACLSSSTTNATNLCSMCAKYKGSESQPLVDLRDNVVMKQTLISYLSLTFHKLDQKLKAVCVQCIYKINAHKEISLRLQRLQNNNGRGGVVNGSHGLKGNTLIAPVRRPASTSSLVASGSLDSSSVDASHFHNATEGTHLDRLTSLAAVASQLKPKQQKMVKKEVPRSSPKKAKPSSVSTENLTKHLTPSICPKRCDDLNSNKVLNDAEAAYSSSFRRLTRAKDSEKGYATEESPVKRRRHQSRCRPPSTECFQCAYCSRVYKRKYYYIRHRRRCFAKHLAKSCKSVAGDNAALEEGANSQVFNREFHCSECQHTADTITKLREHRRSHWRIRECRICAKKFNTLYEYEFHCIECEAKDEILQYVRNHTADDVNFVHVPATRARSRAATEAKSCRRRRRRARSRARTLGDYTEWDSMEDDSDFEDDDNDGVSVADTMYSKRLRFTGSWVRGHSNSNSRESICDNSEYFPYGEVDEQGLHFTTFKGYDLYLLDRLRAEFHMKSFSCTVPNCSYQAKNVALMMRHDYVEHWSTGWFYCKKCRRYFTSKVYLDYHLHRQNGGRFLCYKCTDIFEFQHQLDYHLLRHGKGPNYVCHYCNFEFLTEVELLQHCEIEGHHYLDRRRLICIDHSMTISNKVPKEEESTRRNTPYCVRVMEMHLPRMPSKRPFEVPRYRPFQRRIGEMEFEGQRNPNCWGCSSGKRS